jgi:putative transposase
MSKARGSAARQLDLPIPRIWGGRRAGAGRKPNGERPGVPHRTRPFHDAAYPVHVTLRARGGLPTLRGPRVFPAVRAALTAASRFGLRVCHFSAQADHLHLIVEAHDRQGLSKGMRGLAIRVALAVNRALGRRGRVWADRWHGRALTTPREARNALIYVLMNWKKHRREAMGLDPCSSARWFDGWKGVLRIFYVSSAPPVAAPETWLLRVGWRRHGLLTDEDCPQLG